MREIINFFREYRKPKNFCMAVITIAGVVTFVSIYTASISEAHIPYILMIFIVLISLYLVALAKDQDEKHDEIMSLINDQKDYVPFTDHIMDSQFEFRKLACDATRSIFLIGPNLNFLAEHKQEIKGLLFQKLENDPRNFKIRMLLSDPGNEEICKVMSEVSFTKTFKKELDIAINTFKVWKKEAEEHKPPLNLMIRKTDVITISLLFVDAEDKQNARLLVTPVPWNIPGKSRPCFLIKKQQHESAFNKYDDTYGELFSIAEDID